MYKPLLPPSGGNIEESQYGELPYPMYASLKEDGVRGETLNGDAKTRQLKPIPNVYIRSEINKAFAGIPFNISGEICSGPNVQTSTSAVMSEDGEPEFTFGLFSLVGEVNETPFSQRYIMLKAIAKKLPKWVHVIEQVVVNNEKELKDFVDNAFKLGYEGVVLRSINGRHKDGRSTLTEPLMLRIVKKKMEEAVILSCYEQMENTNEKKTNALGRSERSSAKAGKVGKGILGGWEVRDIKTGIEFRIGGGKGVDDNFREFWWKPENRKKMPGMIIKYSSKEHGVKEKPRQPQYECFRDRRDM
jgi:DNA ligase-1